MTWLNGVHIHSELDILIFLPQHLLTWQNICAVLKCDSSYCRRINEHSGNMWTLGPTNLTPVLAQWWSNWISTCRNCVMTQLHSRCCLKSAPPPFSAVRSTLISQSRDSFCGLFHQFGLGDVCSWDDHFHSNPEFSSRVHACINEPALCLKFHYHCSFSLFFWNVGAAGYCLCSITFQFCKDCTGMIWNIHKITRQKRSVGETSGRLLPKQTQLAECRRQLAD